MQIMIKKFLKWAFGIVLLKGEFDRFKVETQTTLKELQAGQYRQQWDFQIMQIGNRKPTKYQFEKLCDIHCRYKSKDGNGYVDNEFAEMTKRYNK